ncbi:MULTISPECIES: hypothetical protein [unclassified Methylococcus]|uniref:preATP grasp domain-containing protein n=1 Tax=unclassified Methylococcus TaxID=2618889 RepID=UPI003D7D665D
MAATTKCPSPASTRPSLPVVEFPGVGLDAAQARRIAGIAKRMLADEPTLASTRMFGDKVSAGVDDAPALLFEDHAEITLYAQPGADLGLQYRALMLAGDEDMVLIGGPRSEDFETYCRHTLGLGSVTVLGVPPASALGHATLPERCAATPSALEPIVETARRHRRLNLIPYIGTRQAWRFAGLIAERTGARVKVAAPPPHLTQRVNDKLWFARCVKDLLGPAALPPSYCTFGPVGLVGRLGALARRFERIVIKIPDSAGGAGNLIFLSELIRRLPPALLSRRVSRLLARRGWNGGFPLLVGAWDCEVLASPSVQIWIPARDDSLPLVEGIFDQAIGDEEGTFVGAMPCELPESLRNRLAGEALQLAHLFQQMGYFGRCSFDAVIAGNDAATALPHWIECNGRWGGTSIPMTLANRLLGDWKRRALLIVQRTDSKNRPCSLPAALARLGPLVFRDRGEEGIVILTPAGLETGTGMHLMSIAGSTDAARRQTLAAESLLRAGPTDGRAGSGPR